MALQITQHLHDLIPGEYGRESARLLCTDDALKFSEWFVQNSLVKEYQCIECLILGAGSHIFVHGKK
jgi:hypothetical protein